MKGQVREADHAETTKPGYAGDPTFTMVGYDEHNRVLWSVGGLNEVETVR